MSKKDYELLGVSEDVSDEELAARYEELKKKYSEERFLEGEAGNEAARMLNRNDVAYNAIVTERGERHERDDMGASYAKVDAFIREGKMNEAQAVLDEFNERPAEWHYLQSAVFYKKNWVNESKKQLEIAMQMDPSNEKYKSAYTKLKDKMAGDARRAENADAQRQKVADDAQQPQGMPYQDEPQQMGGSGLCEQCATCCACNLAFNCCMNACCGCR